MSIVLQIFLVLASILGSFLNSQTPVFKEIRGKADYPFLIYKPEGMGVEERPPIILFLHGRSLSGNDLSMVTRYGVLDAIRRGKKVKAYVVAPQVGKKESWQPDKVLSVLNYVQSQYETDTTRVYVVGMSLGGYGTLHFAGKYPNRIAAGVAMCGGGNPKDACNLGKTNLWILHGKLDRAVPFTQSLEMFDAIASCKPMGECILTLYPKYGHGELAHEFYKDTLYDWLFQFQIGGIDSAISMENKPILEVKGVEDFPDSLIRENALMNANERKETQSRVYVVKKGDSLSYIAHKHKSTVAVLCKLNGIRENSVLQIGQKIKVP
jgi:LysM repeat protein